MFFYSLYGLVIKSFLALPECEEIPSTKKVDVNIIRGDIRPLQSPGGNSSIWVRANNTEVHFFSDRQGSLLVRAGNKIIIDPVSGVDEGQLRLCILVPAMSLLLHQRGLLVLHGSALNIKSQGVVIVADSGVGKSTLAAALVARGHASYADDVSAIDTTDSAAPRLLSGPLQLNLWPDSALACKCNPNALDVLHGETNKLALRGGRINASPILMKRIYVMSVNTRPSCHYEMLSVTEALPYLVKYSKAAPLLNATSTSLDHLRACVSVSASVPVCLVRRHPDFMALPDLLNFIESDLKTIGHNSPQ